MTDQLPPQIDLFRDRHPIADPGFFPDRFRIDFSTPLEYTLDKLGVFCPLISLIFILAWFDDPQKTGAGILGAAFLLTGIVSALLYWTTNNFYIFDRTAKQVLYHFQILFIPRVRVVASFAEILAITVATEREGWEHRSSAHRQPLHRHHIAMVLSRENILPLSDQQIGAFTEMTQNGILLAKALDVPFIPGIENAAARILTLPDGQVTVMRDRKRTTFADLLLTLVITAVMLYMIHIRMTYANF